MKQYWEVGFADSVAALRSSLKREPGWGGGRHDRPLLGKARLTRHRLPVRFRLAVSVSAANDWVGAAGEPAFYRSSDDRQLWGSASRQCLMRCQIIVDKWSLTIPRVISHHDDGNYTCVVSNVHGLLQHTVVAEIAGTPSSLYRLPLSAILIQLHYIL